MWYIDLRSDTVTQPTPEMRTAMFTAEVGDDVYGEDETIKALEQLAARMVNKEAALFVTSGTMGNPLAIMTHTKQGDEVIAAETSHTVQAVVGGAAVLAGVTIRTAAAVNGFPTLAAVKDLIRPRNVHFPDTGLICVEHATSLGTVVPLQEMRLLHRFALERGIPVHLDGARLFNAAVSLGVTAAEIAAAADSVMFCLSKGLAAPVGSLLAGTAAFIEKARRNRKMLGGGLRQAGFLAAAGIVALTRMVDRLAQDHVHARLLAEGLSTLKGIKIDLDRVQKNMVFADIAATGKTQKEILDKLLARGIKANDGREGDWIRFVTNKDVAREDIEHVLLALRQALAD